MLKKLIIIILAAYTIFLLIGKQAQKNLVSTVRAFGDLTVTYLAVPLGAPIFSVNNLYPGQSESRQIEVTSSGSVARFIAIKGIRQGPSDQTTPLLESEMTVAINGGDSPYAELLQTFFTESSGDGISLGVVNPGETKTYTVTATLPTSVQNNMQNKQVIFDLTFGTLTADHLVINEVYYQVDTPHGIDGSNSAKNKGQNHEWIELYNPTSADISLKNWSLSESGSSWKINANKIIKAGGFALVSKDASVWRYWNENIKAAKIELGQFPKLDYGDQLILKDNTGSPIDQVEWGSITPPIGSSLARLVPGYDTDQPTDWLSSTPPTP